MKKLVAIVDWDLQGHRLTWFALFCRSCLDLGCEVIALCPDPERVKKCLESFGGEYSDNRHIRYAGLKTEFFLGTIPRRLIPGRYHPRIEQRLFAQHLRDALKVLERDFGRCADLVFFACLLEHEKPLAQSAVDILRRPWSGLNMHARVTREDSPAGSFAMADLFQSDRLVSVAVIDEEMPLLIEQSLKKPVVLIPEITDESRQTNHPLERRFRRFAGGSKLVLSIGHLRPNKGIINLASVALNPVMGGVAFAFAGEIPWGLFDPAEREAMEQAIACAPSAIFHLARIPHEVEYNAVFCAGDVIFAAYRDFLHSSGTLTKAAVFEKPLIVSEGHLMARRVREFRMGEVVPQDDHAAIIQAIQSLTQDYPGWLAKNNPRWQAYRELNSYASLVKSFTTLLASC